MTITRVSFTHPFGNIKVEFPLEPNRVAYEVGYGNVYLTKQQAEEAQQHGWALTGEGSNGLVEVYRSSVAYQRIQLERQC